MNKLITVDGSRAEDPTTEGEESRAALVRTIQKLALRVSAKHDVRLFLGSGIDPMDEQASLHGRELWLLAEFLCILIVLDEAESVGRREITRLGGTVPYPIPFVRDGQRRCLWVQYRMRGTASGFYWRPDLVVTEDTNTPSSENVLEIIECKRHANLASTTVRSEFAKSYDLETPAYLLWSYFEVSTHVRTGAENLGLRVRTIGLEGPQRGHLLDPDALAQRVSDGMRETREARPFAVALERRATAATEKANRDRQLR